MIRNRVDLEARAKEIVQEHHDKKEAIKRVKSSVEFDETDLNAKTKLTFFRKIHVVHIDKKEYII